MTRFALPALFALLLAPALAHADDARKALEDAAFECAYQGKGRSTEINPDDVAEYSDGAGDYVIKTAKEHAALLDAAFAKGFDPTQTFDVSGTKVTFADGRKACDAWADYGAALNKAIKASHAKSKEKIAAKYKAAGIDGAKLDVFIEYDDVYWRTSPKCETEDDPKKLAKAKQLFQWLDNADGTVTIRKYQFSGNKVAKITNKTFTTAEKAYKGCK